MQTYQSLSTKIVIIIGALACSQGIVRRIVDYVLSLIRKQISKLFYKRWMKWILN